MSDRDRPLITGVNGVNGPAVLALVTVFRSGGDLLVEPVEDAFAAYAGSGGLAV
jgi:hypothetical protein